MGQVISAGILLVVVVGKGCDGNCGSCGLRSCKTDKK